MVIPWSRAILRVLEGKSDGLVGVGKEEVPELIFPTEELGIANHAFFTLDDSDWQYLGVKALDEVVLGVIQSYSYGELDKLYITNPKISKGKIQAVSSVNGLRQNVGKLKLKRIDALIEDRNVFNFFLQENNIQNNFREAGIAYKEHIYIAFSPLNPNAERYAQLLSHELEIMRLNGQLSKILNKYNLKDWHDSSSKKQEVSEIPIKK